ncbi:MAG: ABC transporter substrate-binding protein [Rhodoferax sp.]
MGTLTGRFSDLGVAGRDGALFAVEQALQHRAAGDPDIVLTPFDDGGSSLRLAELVPAIEAAGVQVLIGPMTSSVANVWVPLANENNLLTLSPTVTSPRFTGIDDAFFTVTSSTEVYARHNATFCVNTLGWKRFALLVERANVAYTDPWSQTFVRTVKALGGQVAGQWRISSGDVTGLDRLLALAREAQPQAIVLVASAADVAYCAQALRRGGHRIPLVSAEWAGSQEVRTLGGASVNGLVFSQFYNPLDTSPRYLGFQAAFLNRFGRNPGFAEVAAFDATQVAMAVLRQRLPEETPKAALLRLKSFEGLQHPIVFSATGDTQRPVHMVGIADGALRLLS